MDNLRLLVIDNEIHVLLKFKDLQRLEQTIRAAPSGPGYGNESGRQASMSMHDEHLMEAIRQRAYALYEERGFEVSDPERDWFQAEAEILASQQNDEYKEVPVLEHVRFEHVRAEHGPMEHAKPESREPARTEFPSARKSSAA